MNKLQFEKNRFSFNWNKTKIRPTAVSDICHPAACYNYMHQAATTKNIKVKFYSYFQIKKIKSNYSLYTDYSKCWTSQIEKLSKMNTLDEYCDIFNHIKSKNSHKTLQWSQWGFKFKLIFYSKTLKRVFPPLCKNYMKEEFKKLKCRTRSISELYTPVLGRQTDLM